jgi:hypothetical protein
LTRAKAVWMDQTLAEGPTYETVKREFLRPSSTTLSCPWEGQARYYTMVVDGQENQDAAWYYPDPKLVPAVWRELADASVTSGDYRLAFRAKEMDRRRAEYARCPGCP